MGVRRLCPCNAARMDAFSPLLPPQRAHDVLEGAQQQDTGMKHATSALAKAVVDLGLLQTQVRRRPGTRPLVDALRGFSCAETTQCRPRPRRTAFRGPTWRPAWRTF